VTPQIEPPQGLAPAAHTAASIRPAGKVRWAVIFCAFMIAAVSYLDRSNISIAASFLQKEFGFSNVQLGTVFSAFVMGYALSQPLGGYIADRFGAHRPVAWAIVWWSAFTALVALVPAGISASLAILLTVRVLLGVGEALIFPATNRLVANWMPSRERGFANGLIFAGVGVGGGVAPPLITYIMITHNWRWAFYVSAVIGLLAGLVWLVIVRDRPRDHKAVSAAELAYIEAGIPPQPEVVADVGWREIIFDRQVALLTVSYFSYGYVAFIFFTWFFKYLSVVRGLDLKASAVYATLPFVAMTLASSLGGLASDRMVVQFGKRIGRCVVAAVSLATASIFVWSATQAEDARVAAVILAGGAGALYFSQSIFWAVSADIGRRSAGRLSAIMNMGSQFGGVVTASLTPVIADAYGWTTSFGTAAAVSLVGGVLWLLIDPEHALIPRNRCAVAKTKFGPRDDNSSM
jgi:MFS transporter, ACS family, glucarate transporter